MYIKSKLVRGFLSHAVGLLGVDVVERSNRGLLHALIRDLHPQRCGRDLIRVGPVGDGGYLVPDDLENIRYAFSPGVSDESGFEAALANRGIKVFLADKSVERPAEAHEGFVFDKKFVGAFSDDDFMTLDAWKESHIGDYDGDLLLQMDIEGYEYETLLAASEKVMRQFRIIVLEVHSLEHLPGRPWFEIVSRVFRKLLVTHAVVHSHPNNCCGKVRSMGLELPRIMEMTFYRKDRIDSCGFATDFPHPLDADNTAKETLELPVCWYRESG